MGIIRKRLATPDEPCDVAPGDEPAQDGSAQPLDEPTSSSPAAPEAHHAPDVPSKPLRRSKRTPDVTRPLVIMRVQSRPKQLPVAEEGGAPDWSLSAGVATVLFGFVIAFGTYVTLTQREAVQSRMGHFANVDKPHPAKRDSSASPGQPALDVAQAARAPIDTPPVPVAVHDTAMPHTAASDAANASVIVTHEPPPKPPVTAAAATAAPAPSTPTSKRNVASATAAPVRAAPKTTAQDSSATTTQARAASTISKERPTSPKTARTACGALGSCDQNIAHVEQATHEPATVRPPVKSATTTTVIREAAGGVPAAPVAQLVPPSAQAESHTEAAAALSLTVNKNLFRQH
ncbi:hypothetical protein SAMN04487926_109109 [Paraburkholderia steynii]|uniref:Uncharacterized protein n=1 Tax=Paraburkholderia steynii TaxID=1245441 RepID=A0A7Z7FH77_9BURK|nr:hypothetical protein [Paraburkholderia steynii]SDH88928.1 hypothetical protein SAMN04487926_109109 [Paraburkholderia steynii]